MQGRCLAILVLTSFCCWLVSCSDRVDKAKKEEVVRWLKMCPSAEEANDLQVVAYRSGEEWEDAGRKIEGIEKILIDLATDIATDLDKDPTRPARVDMMPWFPIACLAYVGSPNSVPALIKILEDKNQEYSVRSSAGWALGKIGDPAAVEPLCRILSRTEEDSLARGEDSVFKFNAIYALGMLGDPNAIPVIEKAVKTQEFTQYLRKYSYREDRILEILEQLKGK